MHIIYTSKGVMKMFESTLPIEKYGMYLLYFVNLHFHVFEIILNVLLYAWI
jgi:hypothetical protein